MHCSPAQHRPGFTFIEVMFAVLVMGAGVAMIAVMLPAAVRQTKDLREAAGGTAAIEAGFHAVEAAAQTAARGPLTLYGGAGPAREEVFPTVGMVTDRVYTYPTLEARNSLGQPFVGPDEGTSGPNESLGIPAFEATLGSRVLLEPDAQVDLDGPTGSAAPFAGGNFAWIPFYRRDVVPATGTPPPAEIAMVAIAARNVDAINIGHFKGPDMTHLPRPSCTSGTTRCRCGSRFAKAADSSPVRFRTICQTWRSSSLP